MNNKDQSSKIKTQNHNSNLRTNLKYRTYQFSLAVIKLIGQLPNRREYWIISDQLIRSVTNIGANLIEAKASSSRRDFLKFFEIALKSANETLYWLSLLKDLKSSDVNQIVLLIEETKEISRMLGSSVLTLKGKKTSKSFEI